MTPHIGPVPDRDSHSSATAQQRRLVAPPLEPLALGGRRLEELGVAHFEEPLPQYNFPGLRQVVDALDCAISTGEQEISAWRFRDLMMLGTPTSSSPTS